MFNLLITHSYCRAMVVVVVVAVVVGMKVIELHNVNVFYCIVFCMLDKSTHRDAETMTSHSHHQLKH